MSNPTSIAVDLAKNVFEIALADDREHVLSRHRLSRPRFRRFLAKHPPCDVVMEACGSGHYWARVAAGFGHRPILLPPAHTRPFVLRNKTDRTDASGLLMARRHPDMHEVAPKTKHQQTLTVLHRFRSTWIRDRTRRISTVRGVLRELGVFIPKGARFVVPRLRELDKCDEIPVTVLLVLAEARDEIVDLERRIALIEKQLDAIAKQDDTVQHLLSIPDIGLITATALVAFVGDFTRFPSGRHFASFLGLTPRERSSGENRSYGRISKQGNRYLRTLLIHGARAALLPGKRTENPDRLRMWAISLETRSCHNKAAVAVANKISRIVWAVATRSTNYKKRRAAYEKQNFSS